MRSEVLVIGGGLSGSAAAILLARAGRRVVLVERTAGPEHKVCGEFLSDEALVYLAALGLGVDGLGAVPIHTVGFGGVSCALPFRAKSLTRCRLDEDLLRVAVEAGAHVLRRSRVVKLDRDGGGWMARFEDGRTIAAPTVFLANGKHDLLGHARPAGTQNGLVGFKMYFRLRADQEAALAGRVELSLFPGGYAGLEPVEDGVANLCLLVERATLKTLPEMGERWGNLLAMIERACPNLRVRLEGATPMLARPLTVASIPYGYVRQRTVDRNLDGLWGLGDQAAVIPSFTGDGMSIALHSGCLAASMLLAGATAADFQDRLAKEVSGQVRLATAISRGLVRPSIQMFARMAVKVLPGLLGLVARSTRIPAEAMSGPLGTSVSTVGPPII